MASDEAAPSAAGGDDPEGDYEAAGSERKQPRRGIQRMKMTPWKWPYPQKPTRRPDGDGGKK
jgi:hypothetical protein